MNKFIDSSGLYLFDIYFDEQYPKKPPEINLVTTGNNIRFNPKFLHTGEICMELLNT